MTQTSTTKDAVLARISPIVDNLMPSKNLFQERLNKDEIMQFFSSLLDKVSPEKIMHLDDEKLTKRVRRVMVIEAVSGTLNDLTPEQMAVFDEAVEGRVG